MRHGRRPRSGQYSPAFAKAPARPRRSASGAEAALASLRLSGCLPCTFDTMSVRLVAANRRPRGNDQPVPAVDDNARERQDGELVLVEMLRNALEELVGHVRFGDTRQRFCPLECRALAVAEEGRLAPGVQRVNALLRFAVR